MGRPRAVIIGAGALGLGFLAERMAPDYELCLADLAGREPLLRRIQASRGYDVNICRPGGLEVRPVRGAFAAASIGSPSEPGALAAALRGADLVLTAAGVRALPGIVSVIAPILNGSERRVWLLFCENGMHVAARHGTAFAPHVTRVDTVMSRMCRFTDPEEAGYAPLWPGGGERLVAEAYAAIPLDRAICRGGPFSPAFTLVESGEFAMWEDIKLFMHNGVHAFLSYHAFLEGTKRFPGISASIRAEALRVMREELVPAILFHHPPARRETVEAYGMELLARFVDPRFNDSIERGVRGAEEKLAPGERLLAGRQYISEAGIQPRGYATTIDAAQRIVELQRGRGGRRAGA
jgi:mannitol-1-phosphate/altronate dehydrogenase